MNTNTPEPTWPSRDTLMSWLRGVCPDLQLRSKSLDDGRLACLARFTYRGEPFEIEAIVEDTAEIGAVETALRRSVFTLYQRMHLRPPPLAGATDERSRRDREIVFAALRGDAALADQLGRELVMANEGFSRRAPVRARWER